MPALPVLPSVLAHGVGARGDLPVDIGFLAWGSGLVLVVSFAAFGVLWTTPRLAAAAERTRPLGSGPTRLVDVLAVVGSVFAFAVWAMTISSALFGSRFSVLNPAPWVVYIAVWTAMPMLSFLLGDIWRAVSPLRWMARGIVKLRGDRELSDYTFGAWPAALSLLGFIWLELAYHASDSPRVIGWLVVGYSAWAVLPAAKYGTEWTDRADGIGWWFSTVASMAPWRRREQLERRVPTSGLANLHVEDGALAAVLIVLGGATFDGFTRTDWWNDIAGDRFGWGLSGYASLGLVWILLIVGIAYFGAARFADRVPTKGEQIRAADAFMPSLVPIAFGYGIAHTFSLLVFEGQSLLIRISDPYGNGADWFGTNTWIENYQAVSTDLIAWVQVASIVIGHVLGVMVAHDRALTRHEQHDDALRSQYAMIIVMVGYTVAGLLLLVSA